jgi:serine protease Do
MKSVGVREAKAHFSALVRSAAKGERIIITNFGKPLAVITSVEESASHVDGSSDLPKVKAAVLAITEEPAVTPSRMSAPRSAAAIASADLQSETLPSFALVVERVRPAIVSLEVEIEDASAPSGDLSDEMDNRPPQVHESLKRFGNQNGSFETRQGSQPVAGQGSGFFISADGYVVTNSHVVENAKTVTVTTDDGKTLDAKLIGANPKTHLALLKVIENGDYACVSFVKSRRAWAIGSWRSATPSASAPR